MRSPIKLLFLVTLVLLFIATLLPKATIAEIATTKDWIGLFEITSPAKGNTKADTITTATDSTFPDGHAWVYTSSCTQKAGTVPKLSDSTGCNIIPNPLPASGTYEYRMYADDQETPGALIAKSKTITAGDTAPPPGGGTGFSCPQQNPYPRVQNGLISAPSNAGKFGNSSGTCVIDNQAAFVPYKIPSYEDLFSLYYTQSKASTKDPTPHTDTSNQGTLRSAFNSYDVIWINSSLTINGSIGGTTKTAVVFVNNNLDIDNDFTFGDNNKGIVFVVKGDVNIDKDVDQIDAVIISQGIICTAYNSSSSSCLDGATVTPRLVIYGSLISINQTDSVPILFRRKLGTSGATNDNTTAAEQINNQPKYLVILRNLMSDTWQKWSEIQ